MKIYFDKRTNGFSASLHAKGKWADFTAHRVWALTIYNGHKMKSAFIGPLMITVGW